MKEAQCFVGLWNLRQKMLLVGTMLSVLSATQNKAKLCTDPDSVRTAWHLGHLPQDLRVLGLSMAVKYAR